ncbi:nucleotidyltransferase [Vulcanibacillus modesticaldus]|uniref:Nucleotidyltransferase n=1 Tax=Vulcanibacillus modesticaldus TaxID=337097 RepID=A0A1D2YWB0_9BACI|nr:nucleotidyltransferase family protein [Vulcanibacillus modesticaldus]OEF99973.1 nucleotidyltransferase [Vulcanibacillus modesticaldus]
MLDEKKILKILSDNKDTIKKYGVKKIGLFGSYLRNEQTNESDIDLIVEFEAGQKTFDNYMDLKFELEELFKKEIDLVIAESIKPDLKQSILGSVKYA